LVSRNETQVFFHRFSKFGSTGVLTDAAGHVDVEGLNLRIKKGKEKLRNKEIN
jgi:hypothetical protein